MNSKLFVDCTDASGVEVKILPCGPREREYDVIVEDGNEDRVCIRLHPFDVMALAEALLESIAQHERLQCYVSKDENPRLAAIFPDEDEGDDNDEKGEAEK